MRNLKFKKYVFGLFLCILFFTSVNIQFVNAQVLTGQQIESAVESQIARFLEERGDLRRREINFFHALNDMTLPDGQLAIEVALPGRINYMGVTSVAVRCKVDGRIYKALNFTVRVNIYDVVLTATHDLMYDKTFTESDFRQDEVIVDGRNDYIKDFSVIKSLVPSRIIRAGSPVTFNMFRSPMVIQTNQPVRLRIKYHGIEVSAKGVAMMRGRVGEMIRVKNESSGKIITGKVIDENTVEVTY